DARLHRLSDRAAFDDAWRQLLDWISEITLDRPAAIQWFAECIHDPAQQPFAYRHLQQLARRANLVTFFQLRVITENHHADFGLVEIQRQPGNAVAQVDHFVEHRVTEPFNPSDAVADLADHADVLLARRAPGSRDLFFNFH